MSARVEDVSPNSDNKFLKDRTPGVIRSTAPQGAMCIRVHGTEIGYVMSLTVVDTRYKVCRDFPKKDVPVHRD